jgi:hypothetical protein
MSNVVGVVRELLRSRSARRRTRSSIDYNAPPNPALDGEFMRVRTLRQQALADEEDELVVSSPKDKNFQSLPWDALKECEQQETFSSTATPNSEGPETPASAEYGDRNTQSLRPTPASNNGNGHRRTMSTPVLTSNSNTSASRKPPLLLKRKTNARI